jgi:hypothetical protein
LCVRLTAVSDLTARQVRRAAERKAISSQNAHPTALTGHTVLLPTDDRARHERHLSYDVRTKDRAEDLSEAEPWLKYEKQFRNLALQERSLKLRHSPPRLA